MVYVTKYDHEESAILPTSNVPGGQQRAHTASTTVDYLSNLDIMSRANRIRLSGIVCTIGPVSREVDYLFDMIDTGMNIARMNFSHGTHDYHGGTIDNCRLAAEKYAKEKGYDPSLAIALDTKGPEIRTGLLEGDDGRLELALETGAKIKITTDEAFKEKCTADVLYVDYKNITKVLEPGKRIYIDDGLISVVVKEVMDDHIIGEVENGGNLGSRKGCNLPGTDCDLPAISAKDQEDLMFGIEKGVDMIFASFIRDAAGVRDIRKILGEKGKNILIIPKIENQQGVNNIDEIIAESDGIMVARGDMGIEIPPEKVFIAQKQIIAKCNKAGKPVICATQMLESMVKKPRPTRAEGSDVANAVLDGADCVMLSGETAKGDFPLQCIRTMGNLSREAEACLWNERFFNDLVRAKTLDLHNQAADATQTTSMVAVQASYGIKASAIIAITTTGRTAKAASQYRPQCPILGVTRHRQAGRQMQLHRGCIPLYYAEDRIDDWTKDIDNRIQFAIDFGKKNGFIKTGDNVICITGWRKGAGSSNTVRILNVQ
uniref:Pyruvate kinase n=1 Tax=Tigriopus japonicus TaxID=158387 RepID=A0A3S5XFM1_TIGJA|nr:pyruvate kinase [Tigriopus japonicus]